MIALLYRQSEEEFAKLPSWDSVSNNVAQDAVEVEKIIEEGVWRL